MSYGLRERRLREQVERCARDRRRYFHERELQRLLKSVEPNKKIGVNRHHMTNKCMLRKGARFYHGPQYRNLLKMRIDRHLNLHYYFGNMKWEEIGKLILRSRALKQRSAFRDLTKREVREALFSVFGQGSHIACARLIRRISRAKGRKKQVWPVRQAA